MNTLAFGFGSFTTMDMLIIMGIALLLFGKRLPEVGKSLGKGIVEFKKGLKGVDDEVAGVGETREAYRPPLPPREVDPRPPLPEAGYDDRRVTQGSRPAEEYRQPMSGDTRGQGSDYRQPAPEYRPGGDYRPPAAQQDYRPTSDYRSQPPADYRPPQPGGPGGYESRGR